MIVKYKKNISESKSIVYYSVFITILLRLLLWLTSDPGVSTDVYTSNGYLWQLISPYFLNPIISFGSSVILVSSLGLFIAHLNDKFALIRRRTSLAYVFTIFLFSSHPVFCTVIPQFISLFFLLFAIDILLDAYQKTLASREGFKIGFLLSLASLFCVDFLLCIPVFWIGLFMMRAFNFRVLLASLLGIIIVYWLTIAFFLYQSNLEAFYKPFVNWMGLSLPPVLGMSLFGQILLIVIAALLIVVLFDNQANGYKDKIRIRANIGFLNFFAIYSLLGALFISTSTLTFTTINLVVVSIVLAHFFALADKKWKIFLFYFLVILYTLLYLYYITR